MAVSIASSIIKWILQVLPSSWSTNCNCRWQRVLWCFYWWVSSMSSRPWVNWKRRRRPIHDVRRGRPRSVCASCSWLYITHRVHLYWITSKDEVISSLIALLQNKITHNKMEKKPFLPLVLPGLESWIGLPIPSTCCKWQPKRSNWECSNQTKRGASKRCTQRSCRWRFLQIPTQGFSMAQIFPNFTIS